jgi:hypothetical protein
VAGVAARLALAAAATESIKLGHNISNGRTVMGIGRGDSARRYINQQPVRVGRFEGGRDDFSKIRTDWR